MILQDSNKQKLASLLYLAITGCQMPAVYKKDSQNDLHRNALLDMAEEISDRDFSNYSEIEFAEYIARYYKVDIFSEKHINQKTKTPKMNFYHDVLSAIIDNLIK